MRPPGFIVTGPDSTIAVHTNVRRSGEHQETFLRVNAFKRFPRCPGHIVAKQVVHFVMADLFSHLHYDKIFYSLPDYSQY